MNTNAFNSYASRMTEIVRTYDWSRLLPLAQTLREAIVDRKWVYLCGNGGSAANAMHLANDYLYGISKKTGLGLRVDALPDNPAVITCLANDISYSEIFTQQLVVRAEKDDVLIVLSGSGQSPNVVRALEAGRRLGMKTFAIVGFSGGRCKELADYPIHFPVNDMQLCEDLQLVAGHMVMQWLLQNPPELMGQT
jgi:D-sedoheptulose 7-phosphate isomerase